MVTLKLLKEKEHLFWSRVKKSDGGCWLWTGQSKRSYPHKPAYGQFTVCLKGKSFILRSHRASYMLHHNVELTNSKQFICHHCDVTMCVNPDHLFLGTNEDNMKDMAKKGRACCPKLDVEKVVRIKKMLAEKKSHREIARVFGVSRVMVCRINRGRVWAHVKCNGWEPSTRKGRRLTKDEVSEIKRLLKNGTPRKQVASNVNVSLSVVNRIAIGRTHREEARQKKGIEPYGIL